MPDISAAKIKELRSISGSGFMDCKKALLKAEGNIQTAVDILRKEGLSSSVKRAEKDALEGLISSHIKGNVGALLEVSSETDFVSRNSIFQNYVKSVTELCVSVSGDISKLGACKLNESTVDEELSHLKSIIGENILLRRSSLIKVKEGVVSSYIHSKVVDGMGKIGVLVGMESKGDKEKLDSCGRKIAMHIASEKPLSLDINTLDKVLVDRELNIYKEQAASSKKPDHIVKQIISGRLSKFYEEVVLLEQKFIFDRNVKISKLLEDLSNEVGCDVKITSFACFVLGGSFN